ncbi:MAG TPA: HupE/UreJ family protein [Povalibacter sp.]
MTHLVLRSCFGAILLALCFSPALAHEVRPAYLELHQTGAETYDALWKVPARGEDLRLGLYVEFPVGTSNATSPRASMDNAASTERWSVTHAGGFAGSTIHIAGLAGTMTDVLVRIEWLDGTSQVTRLTPSSPSFVVEAAPGGLKVARTYLALGVEHILFGFDHLLFVLSLLILLNGWRRLVGTITAFTLAHSITLAAATLGFVHVPGRPVEAVIALSMVFVAAEIVRGRQGQAGFTARAPWVVAFTFGLLHGLGFAGALSEIGLPQKAVPLALLFFNVGVELGQLLFIGAVMAAIAIASRAIRKLSQPDIVYESIAAYAIGGVGAFWSIERTLSSLT